MKLHEGCICLCCMRSLYLPSDSAHPIRYAQSPSDWASATGKVTFEACTGALFRYGHSCDQWPSCREIKHGSVFCCSFTHLRTCSRSRELPPFMPLPSFWKYCRIFLISLTLFLALYSCAKISAIARSFDEEPLEMTEGAEEDPCDEGAGPTSKAVWAPPAKDVMSSSSSSIDSSPRGSPLGSSSAISSSPMSSSSKMAIRASRKRRRPKNFLRLFPPEETELAVEEFDDIVDDKATPPFWTKYLSSWSMVGSPLPIAHPGRPSNWSARSIRAFVTKSSSSTVPPQAAFTKAWSRFVSFAASKRCPT